MWPRLRIIYDLPNAVFDKYDLSYLVKISYDEHDEHLPKVPEVDELCKEKFFCLQNSSHGSSIFMLQSKFSHILEVQAIYRENFLHFM